MLKTQCLYGWHGLVPCRRRLAARTYAAYAYSASGGHRANIAFTVRTPARRLLHSSQTRQLSQTQYPLRLHPSCTHARWRVGISQYPWPDRVGNASSLAEYGLSTAAVEVWLAAKDFGVRQLAGTRHDACRQPARALASSLPAFSARAMNQQHKYQTRAPTRWHVLSKSKPLVPQWLHERAGGTNWTDGLGLDCLGCPQASFSWRIHACKAKPTAIYNMH